MEALEPKTKTENIAVTSRVKSSRRSTPPKKSPQVNGDQVIQVVLSELLEIGYKFEIGNYEDNAGNLTAAIFIPGKVWSKLGSLVKKEELENDPKVV